MAVYAIGDAVPEIHPEAYIHPDATVIGQVTVGAGSTVWPGAVLRGDYGTITIGDRTSIQDGTVVHATETLPTVISVANPMENQRRHLLNLGLFQPIDWKRLHAPWYRCTPRAMLATM